MSQSLTFVVPGDIQTRTGGYEYDRRIIDALRRRGWTVTLCQLGEGFPHPSRTVRAGAAATLRGIASEGVAVVDGLALGVLPDEVLAEADRLRIVGLVHHPLARETGLDPLVTSSLFESERRALTSARHVVTTSPATARALAEYGVSATKVSVVVPGTDRAELAPGSGGHEVRLLCVASVVPRKGHDLLLRALARLKDLPWHLTCGGSLDRDPETAQALATQVKSEEFGRRVELVGELSQAQLSMHYGRADVFVLPTLYEGYGMVVAEAIARGLPSVATDTGGIADLLAGDAGIVVPPGDLEALTEALRRVIADPAARSTLAAGARRVRERLPSWDDAAEAMEAAVLRVA